MPKRILDVLGSGIGLLVLSPLLIFISLVIKLDSPGPVFFRQERVGRFGKTFRIHKFRTMSIHGERQGHQITVSGDARVTRAGRWLRKRKLDELAQLIDVFVGDMSLVGPRPEVPQYVACYPKDAREVILSVRPGITDWASIEYRNENEILGRATDPKQVYVNDILPIKVKYYMDYVATQSLWGDLRIIFATLKILCRGSRG